MDRLYDVAERLIMLVVEGVEREAGRGGGGQAPPRPAGRGSWSQALSWRAVPRVTTHCSPLSTRL